MKTIIRSALVLLATAVVCLAGRSRADEPEAVYEKNLLNDVVELRRGGELEGKVRETETDGRKFYLIQLAEGGVLKLDAREVRRVISPQANLAEYQQRLQAVPNTVDAHYEMYEWCRDNKLPEQGKHHLYQILKLDPDHSDARVRLKFDLRDGLWQHQDLIRRTNGYVEGTGSSQNWILPQDKTRRQWENQDTEEKKQLKSDISRWWRTITKKARSDPAKSQQALANLRSINHPAAVEYLMRIYHGQKSIEAKKMILDIVGEIPSGRVQQELLQIATTGEREMQDQALRIIKQKDHFDTKTAAYSVIAQLAPKNLAKMEPQQVNQIGYVLGQLGETEAILPLIRVLVTRHKRVEKSAGNMNFGFSNEGGVGMQQGDNAKQTIQLSRNPLVLEALQMLTNASFQYDTEQWTDWYIQEKTITHIDLRRDD